MAKEFEIDPRSQDSKAVLVNEGIRASHVLLVSEEGVRVGLVERQAALDAAQEASLDLVQVGLTPEGPVCRLLDYGKLKYKAQKRASEARKKQHISVVKEVKLSPGIDVHDYAVRLKHVKRFLKAGDRVKVILFFRGREAARQDLGLAVLERLQGDISEVGKVEVQPTLEGRRLSMVLTAKQS